MQISSMLQSQQWGMMILCAGLKYSLNQGNEVSLIKSLQQSQLRQEAPEKEKGLALEESMFYGGLETENHFATFRATYRSHPENCRQLLTHTANCLQEVICDWSCICFWKHGVLLTINSIIQPIFIEPLLCMVPGIGYTKTNKSQPLFSDLFV